MLKPLNLKFFGEQSLAVAFFKQQHSTVCALCLQQLQTATRGTEEYRTAISLLRCILKEIIGTTSLPEIS